MRTSVTSTFGFSVLALGFALVVVVMAAGIGGGWVLYRCVETPFMRLRARWTAARDATHGFRAAPGGGTATGSTG